MKGTPSAALILAPFLFSSASGATRVVPTNYTTIQAAISASANGDTVLVLPGTYVENVVIHLDVVVKSSQGPAMTIIDGSAATNPGLASVARISAGSIEGFDIRNGRGSVVGGSVLAGGGILVQGSAVPGPTIKNNWIHDNTLTRQGSVEGGGIAIGVYDDVAARIAANRIYNNTILGSPGYTSVGGAISVGSRDGTVIEGNEIYNNRVLTDAPQGVEGAIHAANGTVRENVIACNSGRQASALYNWGVTESNTIVANWSNSLEAAVRITGGSDDLQASAAGNNICYNVGPGLECFQPGGVPAITFTVECNNIFGNTPGGEVVGQCSGAIGRDGNISVEPQFGRGGCPTTSGDWCLGPDSPLLPDSSPPGCGLVGALGLCLPDAVGDAEAASPAHFYALPPEPNPFPERTVIGFHLAERAEVEMRIYGVLGRTVRTLHVGELGAGDHEVVWDARRDDGRSAASGGYVAAIRAGGREVTETLLLLR